MGKLTLESFTFPICKLEMIFFFFFFKFFKFILFLYFLAVLGLHCRTRALSSRGERGPHFITVRGLLIVVASLVVKHGL